MTMQSGAALRVIPIKPLAASGNQLDFTILPYEIKTFRVKFA